MYRRHLHLVGAAGLLDRRRKEIGGIPVNIGVVVRGFIVGGRELLDEGLAFGRVELRKPRGSFDRTFERRRG